MYILIIFTLVLVVGFLIAIVAIKTKVSQGEYEVTNPSESSKNGMSNMFIQDLLDIFRITKIGIKKLADKLHLVEYEEKIEKIYNDTEEKVKEEIKNDIEKLSNR